MSLSSRLTTKQTSVAKYRNRLPKLSTVCHFRGRSQSPALSSGNLWGGIHPVLLELYRADVVQRRLHAYLVIPELPGNHFVLGLYGGF